MNEFVAFDLETTGVSSFRDVPVSYAFVERRCETQGAVTRSEGVLINPEVPIPPGASAIHGITDDMVKDALALKDAAEVLARRITGAWGAGAVLVGMNVGYDLTMVNSLCQRMDISTLEQRGEVGAVMDVLVLDRHFDKWRRGPRKLTDLCEHYGVSLAGAHSAVEDARASLDVFDALAMRYPEITQISVRDVTPTLRTWYQEWLKSFSAYLKKRGEVPVEKGRYEWPLHRDE